MPKVLITATVASMIDLFNMNNIEILQNMGYEVHVAANFVNGNVTSDSRLIEFKKELDKKKVKYYNIEFSRDAFDLKTHFQTYNELLNLCKINDYEFIHTQTPIAGAITRLVAHKLKIKNIYMAHGFHFFKGAPLKNWIIYFPIEKFLSRYTDVLVTINKEDYNRSKKFLANEKKYIPGIGIDLNKYSNTNNLKVDYLKKELGIDENSKIILSIGELNKNKNHQVVIKALSQIKNSDIHYLIAGQGTLESHLLQIATELGVGKQVHLLGFRKDIKNLLKFSDMFILPSFREGLSVSLMEAMAMGKPVLVSKIRGNVDLIDEGKGGYLFNPVDVEKLANLIDLMLDNQSLREKVGIYNKEKIKDFSVNNVLNKLYKVYSKI